MVGVLLVTQSQGATVQELRAAIGITRERPEAAYDYLINHPLMGLAVQRHGDELRLASTGQVAASVERHLNAPRPGALSMAAQQVLAIVAYRQPVSRVGIETVRGTSSDSALATLLQRRLIALDDHRLFVTAPAFLEYLGFRDLATYRRCLRSSRKRLAYPRVRCGRAEAEEAHLPDRGEFRQRLRCCPQLLGVALVISFEAHAEKV